MPLIAAIISGLLLAAAFPKWDHAWLLPVALIPLFWALRGQSPKRAFWTGLAAGLAANLGMFYWIFYVCHVFGGLPWPVAAAILLLMAAYLSLYRGLWAWGVAWGADRGLNLLWWAPALWVVLEFAQASVLFNGFPWNPLGNGFYRYPLLLQMADLTGVYGLSFLVVLLNATLFALFTGKTNRSDLNWRRLSLVAGLVAVWLIYGAYRLNEVQWQANNHPKLKVAVAKGNIKQGEKWRKEAVQATLNRYRDLTMQVAGADLVVWPETAAPFFFLRTHDFSAQVQDIARQSHAYLLFGAPAWELTPQGERYFNRAYLLSPQGDVMGKYDKAHLVPYGEYVPLQRFFPFVQKMVPMIGDFEEGPVGGVLSLPQGNLAPLICFESIFPYLSRAQVQNGARLLVNITNDAWFGTTSAPYQHLAMAVLRAVENRVSLARAANTGVSAFIGPDGRILWSSDLFVEAAHSLEIPWLPGGSFYSRYGDVFAWVCVLLAVLGLSRCLFRRSRAS